MAELKIDLSEILTKAGCTQAVIDVAAERVRQVTKEGFDGSHDDAHGSRELARAAVAYAQHYLQRQWLLQAEAPWQRENYQLDEAPDCWPWDPEWWKPKDPRRDLIRAAALIVAEIERLDRASVGKTDGNDDIRNKNIGAS